jgi:hypothetical protein
MESREWFDGINNCLAVSPIGDGLHNMFYGFSPFFSVFSAGSVVEVLV